MYPLYLTISIAYSASLSMSHSEARPNTALTLCRS